jgi:hypothetical protein
VEPEGPAEAESAAESEASGQAARAAEPEPDENTTRRLYDEEADPSDTEATAVMPTIEELEVEPPPAPSFGNDREEDK